MSGSTVVEAGNACDRGDGLCPVMRYSTIYYASPRGAWYYSLMACVIEYQSSTRNFTLGIATLSWATAAAMPVLTDETANSSCIRAKVF